MKSSLSNNVCEHSAGHAVHAFTAELRAKFALGRLGFGKVLIVDDNDLEQLRAAELSRDLGATVEVVGSGRSALSILEASDDVWLVLMDCDMPEMSGLEAARQWRAIERGWRAAIPIVGLSRNARRDYPRCIAAGMNDCLSKPLRREDMARCFQRWIQPPVTAARRVVPTISFEVKGDVGVDDRSMNASFELDPDGLKEIEFAQANALVQSLVGKTIVSATVAPERTSIATTDGTTLIFCGFGGVAPGHPPHP